MSLRSCLYDLIPKEVCFGALENLKRFPKNQELGQTRKWYVKWNLPLYLMFKILIKEWAQTRDPWLDLI